MTEPTASECHVDRPLGSTKGKRKKRRKWNPVENGFSRIIKYNPNHDPSTGRFTSGSSGGGRKSGTPHTPLGGIGSKGFQQAIQAMAEDAGGSRQITRQGSNRNINRQTSADAQARGKGRQNSKNSENTMRRLKATTDQRKAAGKRKYPTTPAGQRQPRKVDTTAEWKKKQAARRKGDKRSGPDGNVKTPEARKMEMFIRRGRKK